VFFIGTPITITHIIQQWIGTSSPLSGGDDRIHGSSNFSIKNDAKIEPEIQH
jgi:hypothetical protein